MDKAKLQKELKLQEGLSRVRASDDFQNYLLPILERAAHNKWVNPVEFEDKEAFFKAYTESFMRAKAYEEIIQILEDASVRIDDIAKRLEKNENKKTIG